MIKSKIATIAFVTLLATAAGADTFEKYGHVEGWNVFVDHEKDSCLIELVDGAENVIQMGLTQDLGVGYLGVFTKGETDVKRDEKEDIAILIGENIYLGEATGMRGNITAGYSGGYITSDNPMFVKDIEQQYEMIVFPETEFSFIVDLTGTKKAIAKGRECNQEQMN